MDIARITIAGRRRGSALALRLAFAAGCALAVGGCVNDQEMIAGAPSTPYDYRLRHPITLSEGERTFQIFVGTNRGGLTPSQSAELMAFATRWKEDATGGVLVDLPSGSRNERASADALREVQSIIAAAGVPPSAIIVRHYQAEPSTFATVRVTYPRLTAQAGPCGIWPKDIGPSWNRDYFENQQHWNLGCSTQQNLAAMVDNPNDLVQPRAETAAYTMRRTTVVEKYRQGVNPSTQYDTTSSKISDVGK
jgi:pilus assembly protein CpaD